MRKKQINGHGHNGLFKNTYSPLVPTRLHGSLFVLNNEHKDQEKKKKQMDDYGEKKNSRTSSRRREMRSERAEGKG